MRRGRIPQIRTAVRSLVQAGLLACVSVAVTLGVLEMGLRQLGYQPIYSTYSKSSILWRADPLLGWSHQPGAEDVFVGPRPWPIEFSAPVSINSLGLRGPEPKPPGPGEIRVLLLGDSMVAGFEVPYEETFGARLEQHLSQELRRPVQVINAGVRGYGTDQSYLYYRERGRDLEPDLVIHFHTGNDAENNVTLHRMRRPFGKPAFALEPDGSLALRNQPTPRYPVCSHYRLAEDFQVERLDAALQRAVCRAQLALFDHSALFTVIAARVQRSPGLLGSLYHMGSSDPKMPTGAEAPAPAADHRTRLTTALLLELARTVRADGAEFLLIGEDLAFERLDRDALALAGLEPHGVSPDRNGEAGFRFRKDAHFNPQGHRRLAETLASLVLARVELPDAADPVVAGTPRERRDSERAGVARLATGPFGG